MHVGPEQEYDPGVREPHPPGQASGATALRDVSEGSWGGGWAALDNYMVFQEPCQVLNSHFLMNPLQS